MAQYHVGPPRPEDKKPAWDRMFQDIAGFYQMPDDAQPVIETVWSWLARP